MELLFLFPLAHRKLLLVDLTTEVKAEAAVANAVVIVVEDVDSRGHALAERSELRRRELKSNLYLVAVAVIVRHLDLDLEKEHQSGRNRIFDLEKVLLEAAVKIVEQPASGLPLSFSQVENFELDKSDLASIDGCSVDILLAVVLRGEVLDDGQVFDALARCCLAED